MLALNHIVIKAMDIVRSNENSKVELQGEFDDHAQYCLIHFFKRFGIKSAVKEISLVILVFKILILGILFSCCRM